MFKKYNRSKKQLAFCLILIMIMYLGLEMLLSFSLPPSGEGWLINGMPFYIALGLVVFWYIRCCNSTLLNLLLILPILRWGLILMSIYQVYGLTWIVDYYFVLPCVIALISTFVYVALTANKKGHLTEVD